MKRLFLASAAVAFVFATRGAGVAQTPAATPAPSPSPSPALREIGRVVTSDRRAEPAADASRTTYIVDRAAIDAYGARTVSDALQGVPGIELFSYGPFGAQADYGIRGASSDQTLVLVDGVPITDPTTGAVQLGQLTTIGVDRIEVVESGSSTLYGTSAAGGVINIITGVPRGAYVEASDASFGDRDLRLGAGNGVIGVSLERHVSIGDYPYPAIDYGPRSTCESGFIAPCSFPGGVRSPSYGDQSAARLSLDAPLAGGFRIKTRFDLEGTEIGVPGSLAFPTGNTSQATLADSALVELVRETKAQTLTIDLAGSQTRLAYLAPDPPYGAESDVYSGRSQLSVRDAFSAGRFDGIAGADLSRESGVFGFPVSPNYASDTATPIPAYALGQAESQAAAYVQVGASPVRGTRLVAGLRGENDAPHGSVLAPSFGGTIRSGVVRFAGNVGESFRVPTLQDLYYPGFSNPNLLPEKAQTADATATFEAAAGSLSAGWFDRNGSNFIISPPPYYIPINAQRAEVAGLQITAATRPRGGFIAQASYTDLYRAVDLGTGGRLPREPAGTVTFTLEHPFARTRFDYGLRWDIVGSDGDDRAAVTPPLENTYDAYDSLDAFLRYKFAGGGVLTLRGFNLGNEYAAPVFGYPAPGRRYSLEVSTR